MIYITFEVFCTNASAIPMMEWEGNEKKNNGHKTIRLARLDQARIVQRITV